MQPQPQSLQLRLLLLLLQSPGFPIVHRIIVIMIIIVISVLPRFMMTRLVTFEAAGEHSLPIVIVSFEMLALEPLDVL